MASASVKGSVKKYTATRDFGVNFDNKIKSIKIKNGEEASYDGLTFSYVNINGESVVGPCSSMKAAINAGWMTLKNGTKTSLISKIEASQDDFDRLKGGSFDTAMANEMGKISSKVIRQEDLIVKRTTTVKKSQEPTVHGKLEVVGDQVEILEHQADTRSIVNSSTSTTPKAIKHNTEVVQRDEGCADYTKPITTKKASLNDLTKKKGFIVDDKTPRQVSEDMTLSEIRKVTGEVINADESQEAQVVKKVDRSKMVVQEIEGVTFRKVSAPKEMSIETKVSAGKQDITIKTQVIPGQSISDSSEGTVVATVGHKSEDAAKARAEARKIASAQTQAAIEKKKVASQKDPEKASDSPEDNNYLSMLPDIWSKMHWVQKETWIKKQDNKGLLEFIMSVETLKAVQDACAKRLKELEQETSS